MLPLLIGEPSRLLFTLFLSQSLQVNHWQGEWACWMDHLHGLTVSLLEGGPQAFMPTDQLLQAALQGMDGDFSTDFQGAGNEVGGASWLELVQEPEALLCKGQRKSTCVISSPR
jgi:hypothetical protein